jgi:hypothetical protein
LPALKLRLSANLLPLLAGEGNADIAKFWDAEPVAWLGSHKHDLPTGRKHPLT